MATNVRWRLAKLERAAGPRVAVCGECGNPTGRDGRAAGNPRTVKFRAYFPGDEPEPDGPESCPRCGRVLRREYRMTFR